MQTRETAGQRSFEASRPGDIKTAPDGIAAIQYLRGIAAVMVVFAHANDQFVSASHRVLRDVGWSGVDLFFVISGFVMTYTTAVHRYNRIGFLWRRLVRIAPLYWIMTTLAAGLVILVPGAFLHTHFSLTELATSLAFIPYPNPVTHEWSPLLKLGWTLNYEMFFYVWFCVFLYVSPWRRWACLAAVFGVLIGLSAAAGRQFPVLLFWGNPITLEFLLGCLIAADYLGGNLQRVPYQALIALVLTGIVLVVAGGSFNDNLDQREIWRGVPAALVLGGLVAAERTSAFRNRLLHVLGDASYSIYLTHLFAVMGLRILWLHLRFPMEGAGSYVFVLASVAIATFAGWATYRLAEKPLVRAGRRIVHDIRADRQNRPWPEPMIRP